MSLPIYHIYRNDELFCKTPDPAPYSESAAKICPVGGTIPVDDVPWPTDRSHIVMPIPTVPHMIFTGDRMPISATLAYPVSHMVFELVRLPIDGKPAGLWAWQRTC